VDEVQGKEPRGGEETERRVQVSKQEIVVNYPGVRVKPDFGA
jgi:hypothetical protein